MVAIALPSPGAGEDTEKMVAREASVFALAIAGSVAVNAQFLQFAVRFDLQLTRGELSSAVERDGVRAEGNVRPVRAEQKPLARGVTVS